jgi:hypothetical protein
MVMHSRGATWRSQGPGTIQSVTRGASLNQLPAKPETCTKRKKGRSAQLMGHDLLKSRSGSGSGSGSGMCVKFFIQLSIFLDDLLSLVHLLKIHDAD